MLWTGIDRLIGVKELSERIVSDHGIKDTGDGLRSGQNQ
jgi:hypothetical protein